MDSVGRTIPSKWQWCVPYGLVLVEMCDGGMVCPTLLGDGDGDNDGDDNGDGDDDGDGDGDGDDDGADDGNVDGDDDGADDGADDGDGDGGAPESDISVFSTAFHRISCPSRETYLLRSQMLYI